MSLGYVGNAKLITEDDTYAIYVYSGENWNALGFNSGDCQLFDGEIQIMKSSLEEPEIHTKVKKTPNHRKQTIVKRIPHRVDIGQKLSANEIIILKPCKNEFTRFNSDPYIAKKLLYRIYDSYQENGELPHFVSFAQ